MHVFKLVSLAFAALLVLLLPARAAAAPESHLLRVDPRAAQENGNPILTTVVEVVQIKRVSDAIAHCADDRGTAQWSCMAAALEKPYALYTPFPFPHQNAIFTVKVDGTDFPASYVSHSKWGESLQQPGVGTAWLILVDADSRMGSSFNDAKQLANQFVASLGPNDIVNVMLFNDQQVVKDSKWLPASKRAQAQGVINSVGGTYRASGRNRSLLTIIKQAATDGFKSLGNAGEGVTVPLHQAMVVLSSGYGGADPMTTGPGGAQVNKYLSGGRFPEDNTALPKAPVPVISIFYPPSTWDEYRMNALNFMREMANPEIGGFFSVMKSGDGGRSAGIVNAVRSRFANMFIVKWRVSCIESSITQTFSLVFNNVKPPILPDNSFKEVPVGIDPTTWPLDVNIQYSQDMAKRSGGAVYPGGKFKLYGNFCWGGDKSRAEVYFLPAGQQLPTALSGGDIEKAKRTQQQLIAMGMKGTAVEASDTFVEFEAPDKEKILHGSGDQAVVRLVVYDNKARRTSGVTSDSIVQLKGSSEPFPVFWVLGGAFGLVVILLLVVVIVRSGGRKQAAPPPPPVVAPPYGGGYGGPPGGGYGGPPGGYGAPPPHNPPGGGYGGPPGGGGGGYGMAPAAPPPAPAAAPMGGGFGGGAVAAAPAPAPAPVSPEFMYGGGSPPKYGLTNDVPAQQPAPPNPYAQPSSASRATLQGAAGVFTIVPGVEMRAGRDGSQCGILLTEPRVSGVHATLKLDGGQLVVRDEQSNNGTFLNGNRLAPGAWTPVQNGSMVRFGPVEFSVRLE